MLTTLAHQGAISILSLNRPHRLNALSLEMLEAIDKDLNIISDPAHSCRVLILKGAGKHFCAGADLTANATGHGGRQWDSSLFSNQEMFSNIILRLRKIRQPVIGCIQGAAAGGGMSLALACDVLIVSPDAFFVASFAKIGLSGCELGTSYFLPKAIGFYNANRYLLTGDSISSQEALRLGLVSLVADDIMEQSVALANNMLTLTPLGLELTKKQLNSTLDGLSLQAAIHAENLTQSLCLNHGPNLASMLDKVSKFAKI